jgi:hypothetical protein
VRIDGDQPREAQLLADPHRVIEPELRPDVRPRALAQFGSHSLNQSVAVPVAQSLVQVRYFMSLTTVFASPHATISARGWYRACTAR